MSFLQDEMSNDIPFVKIDLYDNLFCHFSEFQNII